MMSNGALGLTKAPSAAALLGITGWSELAKELNAEHGNGLQSILGTKADPYLVSREAQQRIIKEVTQADSLVLSSSRAVVSHNHRYKVIDTSAKLTRGGVPQCMWEPLLLGSRAMREKHKLGVIEGFGLDPEVSEDQDNIDVWARLLNREQTCFTHHDGDETIEMSCSYCTTDPDMEPGEIEALNRTLDFMETVVDQDLKDPSAMMRPQRLAFPTKVKK